MKRKLSFLLIAVLLIVQMVPTMAATAGTSYNYADAFAKSIMFYEANWCGPDAGSNRLGWRAACHVNDGSDVGLDLTGGFHDCGDHVKFGLPQVYTASTLGWAYYEFKDAFEEKGQSSYMLKILKHFTDYFLKCYPNKTTFYYQCGDGTTDHTYWGPPELQKTSRPTLYGATTEKPASDICGTAAAALALMYLNYKAVDPAYAAKCLTAAKDLYDFAKTYKGLGQSGGFYSASGYWDDLCWGGVWLNIATNDSSYLTDIEAFLAAKGISGNNTYANHWTHCWDDVFGGVFLKLAQITDNSLYKSIAEENLNYWLNGVPKTPAGLTYINSWGALRYTAAECMMALVYYKTSKDPKYLDFAKGQVDYILGSNPRNSSYIVGFGNNCPKFPHHRAASGRLEEAPAYETKKDPEKHLLYGALVGGPGPDDKYGDSIDDYSSTEVGIDYNAGLVGTMAGISKYYGAGQMPEATPGIEPTTPEFYVEARVMEESNQYSTIQAFIHSDTLLPPRFEKGLTFRYFFNLSEYYALGYSASDITPRINYGPGGGVISRVMPWDEANHIYYIEASWPGNGLYGKLEFQFALAAYNQKCWDPSNDYSMTGLTGKTAVTQYIPVYKDGVKIFGEEPTATVNSTIAPTAARFDRNTSSQANIPVTMTLNGNTFSGIKNGTAALVPGTDYTVSGNTVTILKSYLAQQAVGTTNLTFDFSAGTDPVLAVTITDSTPGSTISPVTAAFDKAASKQADIAVTMTLNGNTFSGIKNGTADLIPGTDYTVSGNTVTILKSYLAQQAVGTTNLTFDFSAGADPILTIAVTDSSLPPSSIRVQFYNANTSAQSNSPNLRFSLVNTGTTGLNLSNVKLRYYYTINGEKGQNFICDWSTAGRGNVTGSFAKIAPVKTMADYYLEIGFTAGAGSLAAGQGIEVQGRMVKSDWTDYTQTDDYSFNSTAASYTDWNKVTGYVSGSLSWGTEP